MKNMEDKTELHSQEVREIMDAQPSWLVRWGTVVITVVLLGAAAVIWLKYL